MDAVFIRAALSVLEDWRREADGSRSMAEWHERAAGEAREVGERNAQTHEQTAAEHRSDQKRAEQAALEIEQALREQGVEP